MRVDVTASAAVSATGSGTDTDTAYAQLRPSGTPRLTPQASQRRTSSAVVWLVAGRSATTLLARRRPASEPEEPYRIVLPVECPVAQLCGMYRGAGWSYLHNRVPRTSRWGLVSTCPGAVTATAPVKDPFTATVSAAAAALASFRAGARMPPPTTGTARPVNARTVFPRRRNRDTGFHRHSRAYRPLSNCDGFAP